MRSALFAASLACTPAESPSVGPGNTLESSGIKEESEDFIHGFGIALLNSRQEPARAWLSRCAEDSWLILRLRDQAPNTFAIGSRIEVEAGGRIYRRWLSSGSTGMALSHSTELHFGLGANQSIDRLSLIWPDGEVETWEDLMPRQVLRITR